MAPTIKCKNEFSGENYFDNTFNLFKSLFGGQHTNEEKAVLNQLKGKIDETDAQRKNALLGLERYRLYILVLIIILLALIIVYFMFIASQQTSNSNASSGGGRIRFGGGKK